MNIPENDVNSKLKMREKMRSHEGNQVLHPLAILSVSIMTARENVGVKASKGHHHDTIGLQNTLDWKKKAS